MEDRGGGRGEGRAEAGLVLVVAHEAPIVCIDDAGMTTSPPPHVVVTRHGLAWAADPLPASRHVEGCRLQQPAEHPEALLEQRGVGLDDEQCAWPSGGGRGSGPSGRGQGLGPQANQH